MAEAFRQRRLSREQVDQNYRTALDNLESQRLQAWMTEQAYPEDDRQGKNAKELGRAQRLLQADYEAWLKANPEPAEE